jgi:HTH-type transcriptional repressor of NAD biosynthesis genes
MRKGLVLGKFMPLHKGHIALIDFALKHCDKLYLLVCANDDIEPIPGTVRLEWVREVFGKNDLIEICYTEDKIPYTKYSSRHISALWGQYLKDRFPDISVFISSEKYGEYVAEYLGIAHIPFDELRSNVPISATRIREKPISNWSYLPEPVRTYFVKKVCICGTESTGKSVLAKMLASHFDTSYVSEMAREIPKKSEEYTLDDLHYVAKMHAIEINTKGKIANKILFCDTGLATTKAYASYFFQEIPIFDPWIESANQFDLYLFLFNDVPYVQDGSRLSVSRRDELHQHQLRFLKNQNINPEIITGDWNDRFLKAVKLVEQKIINMY